MADCDFGLDAAHELFMPGQRTLTAQLYVNAPVNAVSIRSFTVSKP